jgi:hypothetical protein
MSQSNNPDIQKIEKKRGKEEKRREDQISGVSKRRKEKEEREREREKERERECVRESACGSVYVRERERERKCERRYENHTLYRSEGRVCVRRTGC